MQGRPDLSGLDTPQPDHASSREYRQILSELKRSGWRLRLPESLEQAFRAEQDRHAADTFANNMGYVFAVYVSLGLLGLLFIDTGALGYWPVSFSVFLVFITAGWLMSFTRVLQRHYQWTVACLASLAAAYGVIHPHLLSDLSVRMLVHEGTVFLVLIVYLGLSLRLVPAFLAGTVSGAVALLVAWLAGMQGDWSLGVVTFGGGSVLGFLLNYRDEKHARHLFLQSRLMELDNARTQSLAAELERLSYLDGLTGVANRRYFDSSLDKAWRAGLRNNEPLTLIMLDVDYFKAFNDYYGHQEGDACLQRIAQSLAAQAARPQDLAARYGGEEFALLFPDTDAQAAQQLVGRILEGIRHLHIEHKASEVAKVVTLSAGVATVVPMSQGSPSALVEMADKALYQAKHAGRDCWHISKQDMPGSLP